MGLKNIFDFIILALGIALIILGLVIWIKKKASITLDYDWKKVKEEDIKEYTKAYGKVYIFMGFFTVSLSLSRILYTGKYEGITFILYFAAYFVYMTLNNKIQKRFIKGRS